MFSFKKNAENKLFFLQIIGEIDKYNNLGSSAKKDIEDLLLLEQGNLCPFCERHKNAFEPTIEHFLPNKFFPHLQLDYDNLYVACHKCNQPKGSHLIPAYIFDERLHPSNLDLILNDREGLNLKYEFGENHCAKTIPAAIINKIPKKTSEIYFSALMEYATLEITHQNRQGEGNSNLCRERYDVYCQVVKSLGTISQDKNKLIRYWYKLTSNPNNYEAFITLKLNILKYFLRKHNIQKSDFDNII